MTTLRLANGMANPSVCLSSSCRLWRACTLLRGFNFSGILHHIVAWPSGNSPTKNHKDRPRGSPSPRRLNRRGVGQTGESRPRPFGGDSLITEPSHLLPRLYNESLLGNHVRRIYRHHFQWPWPIPNPDFRWSNRRIWHIAANISLLNYYTH